MLGSGLGFSKMVRPLVLRRLGFGVVAAACVFVMAVPAIRAEVKVHLLPQPREVRFSGEVAIPAGIRVAVPGKDAEDEFAARDLWSRATDNLARTEIVGQSDRTGYVTVAQGKAITRNKDVTSVGRGRSQNEADNNALELLTAREATTEAAIVYQYFSYGSDSGALSRASRRASSPSGVVRTSNSSRSK